MAGLFSYSLAGVGYLAIGALESLSPAALRLARPLTLLRLRFLLAALLSALVLLSSLVSALFSSSPRDPLGPALPLATAAAAALFLLYSAAGLAALLPSPAEPLLPLPPALVDLLLAAAFGQELLLLHLRRKDPDGLENRYFDLLLVPVLICAAATLLCLAWPRTYAPRLARGIGLVLHGTWLIQMGFSFFSSVMAHGCELHERSSANYTIRCKGHADAHRSKAIATLQFNCHLAFLVIVAVGAYSVVARRREGLRVVGVGPGYRPLSKELHGTQNTLSRFTLNSDDDEEGEIIEERNGLKPQDVMVQVLEANGFHSESH